MAEASGLLDPGSGVPGGGSVPGVCDADGDGSLCGGQLILGDDLCNGAH